MRPETRFNLIFLVAFVAISLPGAVILFRKKLDPKATRMDQPDVMTGRLPYMAPTQAPPNTRWIVPDLTHHWLQDLCRQRTGSERILSNDPAGAPWEPIISSDHLLQVMGETKQSTSTRLALLLWNDQLNPISGAFSVTINSEAAKIVDVSAVPVPSDVRHELARLGYSHPPRQVLWMDVESKQAQSFPLHLVLDCNHTDKPLHNSVDLDIR